VLHTLFFNQAVRDCEWLSTRLPLDMKMRLGVEPPLGVANWALVLDSEFQFLYFDE